jgi:hypothetical protein
MTNESIDPIHPEEEPSPSGNSISNVPEENQDYVSELRETLEGESKTKTPPRKTGFFSRFTDRLKPPQNKNAPPQTSEAETTVETPSEEPAPDPIEVPDIVSAVSLVSTQVDEEETTSSEYDDVEFMEPAELPSADLDREFLLDSVEETEESSITEESSQWKHFLTTLWKPSDSTESDDALDDETVEKRIERSLHLEGQAEQEWGNQAESPFVFDQDPSDGDAHEGKKITGSLVLDDGEDIFSEGDGDIWGGLRQELQEATDETIEQEIPITDQEEEVIPASNAAFFNWEEELRDEENQEVLAGYEEVETALVEPDVEITAEKAFVEEIDEYESRPFSEEYAHVFGEEVEEPVPLESEASVQEIRSIVMEDYEEPKDAGKKTKPSSRGLRNVLLVLIAIGILAIAAILAVPVILEQMQPTMAPAPVAVVQPSATAILM